MMIGVKVRWRIACHSLMIKGSSDHEGDLLMIDNNDDNDSDDDTDANGCCLMMIMSFKVLFAPLLAYSLVLIFLASW